MRMHHPVDGVAHFVADPFDTLDSLSPDIPGQSRSYNHGEGLTANHFGNLTVTSEPQREASRMNQRRLGLRLRPARYCLTALEVTPSRLATSSIDIPDL